MSNQLMLQTLGIEIGVIILLVLTYVPTSVLAQNEDSYLVIFAQKVELHHAASIRSKPEKTRYVYEQLKAHSERSQEEVRLFLDNQGKNYRSFCIANVISLKTTPEFANQLRSMSGVVKITPDYAMKVPDEQEVRRKPYQRSLEELPWGLSLIGADQVWDLGIRGADVVVGGHDTGVDWRHPGLIGQYRGWQNGIIDHNYNWHDAIHAISSLHQDSVINELTNPCGLDILQPCDDAGSSHGTHTVGTMVGHDAIAGITVGVAPQAKWIAVRNMERGYGSLTSYLEGFEWFLAPTDLQGQNPDPSKAPHVINNSWACIEAEGCNPSNFEILQIAVENLRKAGIVVVVSAGNSGSKGCESVSTPAAIYDASFTVGSVDLEDTLSSFSSRGPVTIDGSFRLKPDVVAPGRNVLSCIKGNDYGNLTGTSMSGPHVAGLVALLISANPELAGQVDLIEKIIKNSAEKKDDAAQCVYAESITDEANYLYGYGRINALAAVLEALDLSTDIRQVGYPGSWRVYPNPASDFFIIDHEIGEDKLAVNIYNITGKRILNQQNIEGLTKISFNSWASGIYLVEVVDHAGNSDRKLLQIIK